MPDREKVIEALEACVLKDPDDSMDCRHCPRCNYGAFITTSCINGVMADALALLKAQEPIAPVKVNRYMETDENGDWFSTETYDCGNCGVELHGKANYCYLCGMAVKWE